MPDPRARAASAVGRPSRRPCPSRHVAGWLTARAHAPRAAPTYHGPRHGLPTPLRRLLHCTVDQLADSRHAGRQARRGRLRPAGCGPALPPVRRPQPSGGLPIAGPLGVDVPRIQLAGCALVDAPRTRHAASPAQQFGGCVKEACGTGRRCAVREGMSAQLEIQGSPTALRAPATLRSPTALRALGVDLGLSGIAMHGGPRGLIENPTCRGW